MGGGQKLFGIFPKILPLRDSSCAILEVNTVSTGIRSNISPEAEMAEKYVESSVF